MYIYIYIYMYIYTFIIHTQIEPSPYHQGFMSARTHRRVPHPHYRLHHVRSVPWQNEIGTPGLH